MESDKKNNNVATLCCFVNSLSQQLVFPLEESHAPLKTDAHERIRAPVSLIQDVTHWFLVSQLLSIDPSQQVMSKVVHMTMYHPGSG